jgi:excisionase family DNA binding protein
MIKVIFNIKEAADYLNLSVHTIRKWVNQNRLPFARLGDRIMFRISDLENYVEQNINNIRH